MRYFDLHCDTLYEMYEKNVGFFESGCQVSLENASLFDGYARVCAIWTKAGISDDAAFERYKSILAHAKNASDERTAFCKTSKEISDSRRAEKIPLILAVEGANLLGGDISKLDELFCDGVRFLTLVWKGSDCIGGAWNTDDGLTDFGKEVVLRCGELGIFVDVSHSSRKTTRQAIDIAERCGTKIVATHSNSFSCCEHGRNLTDCEAKAVAALGGVIGISLVPAHLRNGGNADISDVLRHIEHYVSLGIEKNVCIGADFDGVVDLPSGISGERDVKKIYDLLSAACASAEIADDVFWNNAERFINKNM